jgi:hypothetical protein
VTSATPGETTAAQPRATPKWSRRRKASVVTAVVACAVVAGLFLPTAVAGWAPVVHWTCQTTTQVMEGQPAQIPAQLLNAPFGGEVFGNVSARDGVFTYGSGSGGMFLGSGDTDGGVDWNGYDANVSVFADQNRTVWGPGPNVRCTGPFKVELQPDRAVFTGITLINPGNYSDQQVPDVLFPGFSNVISFSDGFERANSANVSTCGKQAIAYPVESTHLTLWAHFSWNGENRTAEFNVPILGMEYRYLFPANFGIWQVDNLSAPGGPGGGWAFSYSQCP